MSNHMGSFRALPCLTVIALVIGMPGIPAMAETIYKSVDAEGNVTFSSTPPAGVEAQQIQLQPGPAPAAQQQSIEAEQNLEQQSNELYQEVTPPPQEEEEPAGQPDTGYQQDSSDADVEETPVYVGDGYVGDTERDRDERVRDGVDDVRDVAPRPAEAGRAAGRAR